MVVLNDFSTSVRKALGEIDPAWETYPGLIVCGTHSPHDIEDMLNAIRRAREEGTPFLGICFGHQLAAVEYARNVLGITDATSEEFGQGTFVVKKLPALNVGIQKVDGLFESFWNNFAVESALEHVWQKPSHFITCQYHPEYQSSWEKPHPLLVKFLNLCKK